MVVAVSRRHNGEGSIFPYRAGYATYAWITTPAGRRQSKNIYGKDRETVHEKWLALMQAAQQGPVAPRSMRLADFMARWLVETVQPDLAPTTAANYALFTRLYVGPDLGRKRLDRLTVGDVQLWTNELKTRCQCCHQGKDSRRPTDKRRCCEVGACCHQGGLGVDAASGLDGAAKCVECGRAGRTADAKRRLTGTRTRPTA